MAESGTDLYLQRLATRVPSQLIDAELGYINCFNVGLMLFSLLPGLGLSMLLGNLTGNVWPVAVAILACLFGGAVTGQVVGRISWDRRGPVLLERQLQRTRIFLLDQGVLRILVENHPSYSIAALEPLLTANRGKNPGNPAKTSADNMEQRLRALIQYYDTLLARIPRREARSNSRTASTWSGKAVAWGIAGGIVALNLLANLVVGDPDWLSLNAVWLLIPCLVVGGAFLVRAIAISNLNERLKRLALSAVLVDELGSEAARALLPPAMRSEMREDREMDPDLAIGV